MSSGISVARQLCRKTNTTSTTSTIASSSVSTISRMPAFTGARRVERDLVLDARREALRQLRHRLADVVGDVERVRARRLEGGDDRGGLAVERAVLLVVERAELDARDVPHAHARAVGVLAHDDVAELLGLDEAPLRAHRVRELLPRRRRLGADLPGRVHDVLRADRVLDVGDREPEARQHVRA